MSRLILEAAYFEGGRSGEAAAHQSAECLADAFFGLLRPEEKPEVSSGFCIPAGAAVFHFIVL